MNTELLGESDFLSSTSNNGLMKVKQIFIFPPNETSWEKANFLWYVGTNSFETPRSFAFLSGYTRLVLRLSGDELLINHDNSAHSHIVKKNTFYEFAGDWPSTCDVSSPCKDFHVTYKTGEVAVSANVFESKDDDDIVIPLSSRGTCTLLYNTQGETAEITYNGNSIQLPVNHVIIFNKDLSFDEPEDEECELQMTAKKGSLARIVCVRFATDPDALSLSTEETQCPSAKNFSEFDDDLHLSGKKTLNMIPSSQYSSTGLHQYKWKRQPYVPPTSLNQTLAPPPIVVDELDINAFEKGRVQTAWINLVQDGFGEWMKIPVIIARGVHDGPIYGITAAVHGNELNGVPGIHRLIQHINIKKLSGAVIACPCVNVTGFLSYKRTYRDGRDLNRTFPGKEQGFASQVYCHAVLTKLISHFEYHIDLHTASFGRVNSYYVRCDMNDPVVEKFAWLCNPQIILHNSGQDGTLRGAATELGIKSITIEVGNPQSFQSRFISWTYAGVRRMLHYLKMYHLSDISKKPPNKDNIILCSSGYWMYTRCGGLLDVYPPVNSFVKKGDLIARVKNIFGNISEEICAPEDGVIVGKSSNPVAFAGDRVIHLGIPHPEGEPLPEAQGENY